jgi:hypothetical protein
LFCIHWLNKGLVAVAKIDRAPLGRFGNHTVRPATIRFDNRLKCPVLSVIKTCGFHGVVLLQ